MRRYTNSLKRLKNPIQFWRAYYRYKDQENDHIHNVRFRNGFRLGVPHKLISAFDEIYLRGVYDEALTNVKGGDVVVDLGANAGYFSLAALMKNRDITLIAVEPLPANHNSFRENMRMNGIDNFQLVEKAVLTNESGYLELYFEEDDQVSVSASMVVKPRSNTSLKVPVLSFDQLMEEQGLSHVDLLKIDCEGAEYNILFNTKPDTFSLVKKIVIETHHWVPVSEGTISQMVTFLNKMGYATQLLHKDILIAERA